MLEYSNNSGVSGVRQQSVDRFIKRFNRDIDEPEMIDERHLILRRVVLRKMKDISEILKIWK